MHKNKTVYEYSNLLTGRYITSIFTFIYIVYFFMMCALISRISCETIKYTILNETPVWALNLLLISAVYYGVLKKLRLIGRICELYGAIIIFAIIFMHLLMAFEGELINIKPYFGDKGLLSYLKSTTKTIIPFLGFEILAIIPINKGNGKSVVFYSTIMIIFIGLLYILIVETSLAIIGPDDIIHYNETVAAAIRRMQVPYLEFLRRIDGVLILTWTMAIFCTIIILAYGCVFLISKWLPKISFKYMAFIVITWIYIASLIPGDIEIVRKMLNYVGYLSIIPAFVIPGLLFLISKVKGYG